MKTCKDCIFNDVCGYANAGKACEDFILDPAKRKEQQDQKRAYVPPIVNIEMLKAYNASLKENLI